jgi:hypothetical protein
MAPLALALVRGTLARSHPQLAVTEHFANILWAEHLLAESGGSVLPEHYHEVAETGLPLGLGDWIFAGVLYRDPTWRLSELTGFAGRYGYDISSAVRMRALAEGFCTFCGLNDATLGFRGKPADRFWAEVRLPGRR